MPENESLIIKNGLNALSRFQNKLDAETWQISNPKMAKLRHISLHVTRISGFLADICHKWEHEMVGNENAINDMTNIAPEKLHDIIADLFMHTTQLCNLINANPYNALAQRVSKNIPRFAPDSKLGLSIEE